MSILQPCFVIVKRKAVINMEDKNIVKNLLESLKAEMTTSREMEIIKECENKLFAKIPSVEIIDERRRKFNGIIFYESKREGRYFTAVPLHKAVYMYAYGEIPDGYEIHHIDFDPTNNEIENLILLTHTEHMKIHAKINSSKCRHLKSKFICKNCGKEYETVYNGNNMFCSRKCQRQYNYRNSNQQEKRICIVCGKGFTVHKYSKTKICSKECLSKFNYNPKIHIIKKCVTCGIEFETTKTHNKKYCSRECYHKATRKE